jgi:hypothetical protein
MFSILSSNFHVVVAGSIWPRDFKTDKIGLIFTVLFNKIGLFQKIDYYSKNDFWSVDFC